MKEALCLPYPNAVKPFVALDAAGRQRKVERRWAVSVLVDGCRDDASARLLRNKRTLPILLACFDGLTTGGLDPDTKKLAFHGSVPPGCASFLKKPAHLLAKVKRDVAHAVADAFRLLEALASFAVGRRALFFESGYTCWAANHLFMEPTGEGKNWSKVARLVDWMARVYAEAAAERDLLTKAPLFFVDLTTGVLRAIDCVSDADDARVLPGDWAKKTKPKRRVDLDPLGTAAGKYPSRAFRRTPEEARARRRNRTNREAGRKAGRGYLPTPPSRSHRARFP